MSSDETMRRLDTDAMDPLSLHGFSDDTNTDNEVTPKGGTATSPDSGSDRAQLANTKADINDREKITLKEQASKAEELNAKLKQEKEKVLKANSAKDKLPKKVNVKSTTALRLSKSGITSTIDKLATTIATQVVRLDEMEKYSKQLCDKIKKYEIVCDRNDAQLAEWKKKYDNLTKEKSEINEQIKLQTANLEISKENLKKILTNLDRYTCLIQENEVSLATNKAESTRMEKLIDASTKRYNELTSTLKSIAAKEATAERVLGSHEFMLRVRTGLPEVRHKCFRTVLLVLS